MRVPVCGRFYPNEGGVAGYGNRMRVKYTAKWGLQIAEMIFQTRSRPWCLTGYLLLNSYFDLTNQGSVCSKYVTIKFPCKKDFAFSFYSYIFI
uniref:DUF6783 domain-containing protein n=1 Tax=Blautia faecicola TaxID=2509240 RepID=UPI003521A2F7